MNPLRWLARRIREAGAPSEDATERDGFLSYSAETHAIGWGVFHGLKTRPWSMRPDGLPDNPDVQAEPHYYAGAYVAGTVLQWAIMLSLGVHTGAIPF